MLGNTLTLSGRHVIDYRVAFPTPTRLSTHDTQWHFSTMKYESLHDKNRHCLKSTFTLLIMAPSDVRISSFLVERSFRPKIISTEEPSNFSVTLNHHVARNIGWTVFRNNTQWERIVPIRCHAFGLPTASATSLYVVTFPFGTLWTNA